MFLLYQEVWIFTRLGFFFLFGAEDFEDDEKDGKEDEEEKPKGAGDKKRGLGLAPSAQGRPHWLYYTKFIC